MPMEFPRSTKANGKKNQTFDSDNLSTLCALTYSLHHSYVFFLCFTRRFMNGRKIKDGLGILIWQDGSKYQGQFNMDQMKGLGRMIQGNGSIYQG